MRAAGVAARAVVRGGPWSAHRAGPVVGGMRLAAQRHRPPWPQEACMNHPEWIVALPFWLMGAPLVLAIIDGVRNRAARR
jgi:hypothetical protein